MQGQLSERAFRVFVCLWALATLFHQAAWPARHTGTPMYALTFAAVCVLLRPSSLRIVLAFLALQIALVLHQLPHQASNHWLFTAFIAMTILLAWAGLAVRRRSTAVSGGELFDAFAPAARLQLLVLYFFAVFHKLNRDFLEPATSCAAEHLARLTAIVPGLQLGRWADYAAIYGTLGIEAAIPILLAFRRTRVHGVALGLVFHLALIFDLRWVFYDFSAMLYALYFLFVHDAVLRGFDAAAGAGGARARLAAVLRAPSLRRAARGVLLALAGAIVLGAIHDRVTGYGPGDYPRLYLAIRHLPRLPFLVYALTACSVLAAAWRFGGRHASRAPMLALRPLSVSALMVPLVFFNGMAPYFGLKTENAFSMFSNLTTEGGYTNHLFMPIRFRLAGYQEDLVRVESSTLPALQSVDGDVLLTFFEFRHLVSGAPGESVTYERNGVRVALTDVAADPALMQRSSLLERKAMQFRRVVPPGTPKHCTH